MNPKEELLSQMYTLRAGMSWLSQKKQQIDRLNSAVKVPVVVTEEQVLEKSKQRLADLREQLDEEEKNEEEALKEKRSFNTEINGGVWVCLVIHIVLLGISLGLAYFAYNYVFQKYDLGESLIYFIFSGVALILSLVSEIRMFIQAHTGGMKIILFVGSAILFVAMCAGVYGFFVLFSRNDIFWMWAVLALSALCLISDIICFCLALNLTKAGEYYISDVVEVRERISELQTNIYLAEQDVEKVKTVDWPKVKQQNEADIAEAHRKINEIRKTQIKPLVELSNDFYDTLSTTFGSSLDVRDWQYIDLVIYYIETNRAESIREALQQVDSERQTQQIVTSMRMATEQICRSIKTEMRALGQSIEYGFSNLESSISNIESSFGRKMASLQASVENNAAQTRFLASAQITQASLTNALLEKSNSTGEQLMNDVHYLREKIS